MLRLSTLDEITDRLVGKAPNNIIVKSLVDNMTESNCTLYSTLIQKAEEEEVDLSSLLRPEQRHQAKDTGKKKEEDAGETDAPSTKFDYAPFVKRHRELDNFSDALLVVEEISNDLQIRKVGKDTTPSGYEIESSAADKIEGVQQSNTIINALRRFDNNSNFLESDSEFSPYIKTVDGKLLFVAISPPKRLDKETQTMVDRNRKPNIAIKPIKDMALKLLKKTYEIEDGSGNMTLLNALINLHTNTYSRTPAGTAGGKKKTSKAMLNIRKKLLGLDLDKEINRTEKQLKKLINIGKGFDTLIESRDACTERINELTEYVQSSSEETIAREISNTVSRISDYINSSRMSPEKLKEMRDTLTELKTTSGGKKGAIVRRVRARLKKIIALKKEELEELNADIIDIGRYTDEIAEVIDYTNRFLQLSRVADSQIDSLREQFLEQESLEANESKLDLIKQKLRQLTRQNKAYDSLEKSLGIAISLLLDLEDEVVNINRALNKIKNLENSKLKDYLDTLVVPLTRQSEEFDEMASDKKLSKVDTKKITGVSESDLKDAQNMCFIVTKTLDRIETQLKNVESDFYNFTAGEGVAAFAGKNLGRIEADAQNERANAITAKLNRRAVQFSRGEETSSPFNQSDADNFYGDFIPPKVEEGEEE